MSRDVSESDLSHNYVGCEPAYCACTVEKPQNSLQSKNIRQNFRSLLGDTHSQIFTELVSTTHVVSIRAFLLPQRKEGLSLPVRITLVVKHEQMF